MHAKIFMDTGGYTALDFALHDSHVLNANVFMWPLGRVGIYRVLLYNLYTLDLYIISVHAGNIIIIIIIMYIVNVLLVYVGLAQARPNN